MKRIIYTDVNGVASIVVPSHEFKGTMEELASIVVPAGITYEIVESTDIPEDRTFRMAWEHDTTLSLNKISINMPKAKDIAHEKRREERSKLFAPLDTQATIPPQANQAEAQRQIIRDADAQRQIDIDAATTPWQLKTLMNTPLV